MRSHAPSSPAENSFESLHLLPPLPETFFLQDTLKVARALIGKGLVVGRGQSRVVVELVEVEAYLGGKDPASHAFRGLTKRNWPMFERGGTCYVYLSYGINYCMNVSTRGEGQGEAVLLRAARPLWGWDLIRERRPRAKKETDLLSGPGKLTLGLAIGPEANGRSFFQSDFKFIDLSSSIPRPKVIRTPRIGITKAADKLWRFVDSQSPFRSR